MGSHQPWRKNSLTTAAGVVRIRGGFAKLTRGLIFDIQRFSINDGPGVRTTVFLKGCPLRCFWCHNPESQGFSPQLARYGNKCIFCGGCVQVCPIGAIELSAEQGWRMDRDACNLCGACAEVCPAEALVVVGKEMSVEEVVEEVLADRPFYETSGGGVTLSGGEPLAQPEFAEALVRAMKSERLHVALDTSGEASWHVLAGVVEAGVDLVLYDIKSLDDWRHRQATGVGNARILANLRKLRAERPGIEIILRYPLVPGFNDRSEDFTALCELAAELELSVDVLPYHPLGQSKYEALGTPKPEAQPDADAAAVAARRLVEQLSDRGVGAALA